jgi:DNA-binding transcriptional LysR family regulator
MAGHIHWEKNIGRRFQLRDLQVFFTVAERSSMAKAATELGVTQPSVSAVIAGLETSLGARLFDRSPQGVELTPVGRALLARGRAAFDELRQGIRDIEFLSEPDVGEVRIGCPEFIAAGFLPAVIDLLSQRHPGISLVITQVNTPTLEFRELDERRIDLILALLAVPDAQRVPHDYAAEVLFEDRLCVVAGGDSPWLGRKKIDLVELGKERWIVGLFDTPGMSWVADMFRSRGAEFPKRYVATFSLHVRNNMAATGRFIATMAESTFDRSAERYGLKMLPIKLPAPRWPVAAVTLRKRNLSPVVNLFLKCARDVAKSYRASNRRSRRTLAVESHRT